MQWNSIVPALVLAAATSAGTAQAKVDKLVLAGVPHDGHLEQQLNLPAGPGVPPVQGRGAEGSAHSENVAPTAPAREPSGYSMVLVGLALVALTRRGKATPKFMH